MYTRLLVFFFISQYVNELRKSNQTTIKHLMHLLGNTLKINISRHRLVENIGVEPMTSCVQGRRSSQLS